MSQSQGRDIYVNLALLQLIQTFLAPFKMAQLNGGNGMSQAGRLRLKPRSAEAMAFAPLPPGLGAVALALTTARNSRAN